MLFFCDLEATPRVLFAVQLHIAVSTVSELWSVKST